MSLFLPRAERPAQRIIALPSAGGGTSVYKKWSVPPHVEVLPARLPGRERRINERPYRRLAHLIEDLADQIPTDLPYVIYGHSMGAWVGFELVRELIRRDLPLPLRLGVGARHAPHIPTHTPPLGRLPQDEFVAGMNARYGAIPAPLLRHPALLAAFLPGLRADVVILDDYRYVDAPPIPVPIRAFYAHDDHTVDPEDVRAWAQHTDDFAAIETSGGHFFHTEPTPILRALL